MKAALIGYGYWGKIIKRYIDDNTHFELVAICSQENIKLNGIIFTNNLNDIVNNPAIEAAFVCTPIGTHFDICQALLTHDKHVFCEKPLVSDTVQLKKLIYLAEKFKKILYTDYIYIASPSIRKMRQIINNIGNICCIEGEISQFGNFYSKDTVFEILGVHLFSVLAYFFPEFVINSCDIYNPGLLKEYGCVNLNINDNVEVNFICSLLSSKKIRTIKIYGTKGHILFDMMDKEATLRFLDYTYDSQMGYKKLQEKTWLFDENNNLSNMVEMFNETIATSNNCENLQVSKRVEEVLQRIRM